MNKTILYSILLMGYVISCGCEAIPDDVAASELKGLSENAIGFNTVPTLKTATKDLHPNIVTKHPYENGVVEDSSIHQFINSSTHQSIINKLLTPKEMSPQMTNPQTRSRHPLLLPNTVIWRPMSFFLTMI